MSDPTPAPATTAARVLVQALARLGVRDVVLAPGSRSAPLAYALAAAALPDGERPAGAPSIELHVRVDERSAAFLALGLARGRAAFGAGGSIAGPTPVAVVTTSGTATANLHPAVLEAHHAGIPLILLTADRPHELRGTGANQTTDQVGLYGSAVRFAADVPAPSGRPGEDRDLRHLVARAVAAARGARSGDPGPVHLDLAYREPLAPAGADEPWPEPVDAGLVSVVARGGVGSDLRAAAHETAQLTEARRSAREVVPVATDSSSAPPPATDPGDSGSDRVHATTPRRGVHERGVHERGVHERGVHERGGDHERDAGSERDGVSESGGDAVPTLVVAGDGAGPVARRIAEVNGWPLLAEPSSGALGGANAIPAYRLLLGHERLSGGVRRAVVLGRPTLSRPVQTLLARDDVEVLVIAPHGSIWPDAARNARTVLTDVPPRLIGEEGGVPIAPVSAPGEWLERWQAAGAAAAAAVHRVLSTGTNSGTGAAGTAGPLDGAPREGSDVVASAPPGVDQEHHVGARVFAGEAPGTDEAGPLGTSLTGLELARRVAQASVTADVLVVGSSNPVRDLDLVGTWSGAPPTVLANRGLAGIDGTVSTALGVALAARGAGRGVVRALLGDLTFLHDVGGLLRGPLEAEPDLQIVVSNDDGGSIFATLEHGSAEHAAAFERVFATPHGADLAALCAGYGVRHTLVHDVNGLTSALNAPGPGVSVVEVTVDRADRRALQHRIADAVKAALR